MNSLKGYDGKNRHFGKIVDGVFAVAPAYLIIDGLQYVGNNSELYRDKGYLPVVYSDKPEDTETGHYEAVYTETDGAIMQSWEFVSDILKGYIDTTKITNFSYFCSYNRIEELDFENIDFSNGVNFRGMFYESSLLTECPFFDTSKSVDVAYMFYNCVKLTTIPQLDTSKVSDFQCMFYYDGNLQHIPQLDTSSGTNFYQTFYRLVKLQNFPQIDTSKGTNFYQCWYGNAVITFPEFNFTNATNLNEAFRQCAQTITFTNLIFDSMPTSSMVNMFQAASKIENITITGTIKVNSNNLNLAHCSNLTVESMLSILNALEDNTGGTRYTVYFGSTNLAKLTDEQKAIAENKNISLG